MLDSLKCKTRRKLSSTSWFHSSLLKHWGNFCSNGINIEKNQFWASSLDFGYGFYLTDSVKKAQEYFEWGRRKGVITETSGLILEFKFSPLDYLDNCKIFETPNEEYAKFILDNRSYNEQGNSQHGYDWVYGQMCDNKPTEIIEKFKLGRINESEAITQLLASGSSFKQLSIHSQEIVSVMRLEKALRLDVNDDGLLITQELNTDEYNNRNK